MAYPGQAHGLTLGELDEIVPVIFGQCFLLQCEDGGHGVGVLLMAMVDSPNLLAADSRNRLPLESVSLQKLVAHYISIIIKLASSHSDHL